MNMEVTRRKISGINDSLCKATRINSYKDNEVDLRVQGKKTIGIYAFSFVPVGHATSSENGLTIS